MLQAEIGAAMRNPEGTYPTRGLRLREFELPDAGGRNIDLADYRGKQNLVLFFLGIPDETKSEFARSISEHAEDFAARDAKVLVAFIAPGEKLSSIERSAPVVVLSDSDGGVHRAMGAFNTDADPGQACYITDKYAEVFAAFRTRDGHALPEIEDVLSWLDFIEAQCPECEPREWPVDAA